MKNHRRPKGIPFAGTFRRLMAAGILLASAFVSIGVLARISKQRSAPKESNIQSELPNRTSAKTYRSNPGTPLQQTAQVQPLTQEEAQKLAAALKVLANQSTDGLRSIQHDNGSVSLDLEGRFQNVAVARKNEDGTVSEACIDNPAAGAAFFGIDPTLVGVKPKVGSRKSPTSPANK